MRKHLTKHDSTIAAIFSTIAILTSYNMWVSTNHWTNSRQTLFC